MTAAIAPSSIASSRRSKCRCKARKPAPALPQGVRLHFLTMRHGRLAHHCTWARKCGPSSSAADVKSTPRRWVASTSQGSAPELSSTRTQTRDGGYRAAFGFASAAFRRGLLDLRTASILARTDGLLPYARSAAAALSRAAAHEPGRGRTAARTSGGIRSRREGDWSITWSGFGCDVCDRLARFVDDRAEQRFEWPLAKPGRARAPADRWLRSSRAPSPAGGLRARE